MLFLRVVFTFLHRLDLLEEVGKKTHTILGFEEKLKVAPLTR